MRPTSIEANIDLVLAQEGSDLADHPRLVNIREDQHITSRLRIDPETVDHNQPVAQPFKTVPPLPGHPYLT